MKVQSLNLSLEWFFSATTEFLSTISGVNFHRSTRGRDSSIQIGPYSLVQLAYEGELIEQGIPSQAALVEAHRGGRINAIALVKRAVKAKLMSAKALSNTAYLAAVENAFLLHYLFHPAESSQQNDIQSRQQRSEAIAAARRTEQRHFLERRRFW